ncbi:MAG: hypothetical protein KAR32_10920, partial [Candidatus Omnitrophica bacterium]|nr:hypothetical protein [Candidatus Omnitrophota bacterium]
MSGSTEDMFGYLGFWDKDEVIEELERLEKEDPEGYEKFIAMASRAINVYNRIKRLEREDYLNVSRLSGKDQGKIETLSEWYDFVPKKLWSGFNAVIDWGEGFTGEIDALMKFKTDVEQILLSGEAFLNKTSVMRLSEDQYKLCQRIRLELIGKRQDDLLREWYFNPNKGCDIIGEGIKEIEPGDGELLIEIIKEALKTITNKREEGIGDEEGGSSKDYSVKTYHEEKNKPETSSSPVSPKKAKQSGIVLRSFALGTLLLVMFSKAAITMNIGGAVFVGGAFIITVGLVIVRWLRKKEKAKAGLKRTKFASGVKQKEADETKDKKQESHAKKIVGLNRLLKILITAVTRSPKAFIAALTYFLGIRSLGNVSYQHTPKHSSFNHIFAELRTQTLQDKGILVLPNESSWDDYLVFAHLFAGLLSRKIKKGSSKQTLSRIRWGIAHGLYNANVYGKPGCGVRVSWEITSAIMRLEIINVKSSH